MKKFIRFAVYPLVVTIIVSSILMVMTNEKRNSHRTLFDNSNIKEVVLQLPSGNTKSYRTDYVELLGDGRGLILKQDGGKILINGTFTVEEFLPNGQRDLAF